MWRWCIAMMRPLASADHAQRTPGAQGISGDGRFSNLTFTAKAKGTGAISIAVPVGARNSKNQPMDVLGSQTTVTVN